MPRPTLSVSTEIRVLLIEDDHDDALLILRQLKDHGFAVTADRVDRLDALRGHLVNKTYDVIISDFSLPSFTAIHALRCVRDFAADTPFVVVSGTIEEETAVELVKQGASDFLNKDRLGRAGIAVEAAIRQCDLQVAKRFAEAQQSRAEERSRHSEKMEAIGRLAGGVAHDFNNLLSIILNYADLVLDDFAKGAPNAEDVAKIKGAAERGANLTGRLLALSRKEPASLERLDLRIILEEMRMLLDPAIGEDVDLVITTSEELSAVEADPGHIEQVLLNLAVNARDAMPDGGVLTIDTTNVEVDDVYAATSPDLDPGRYVRIRVSDTGTGIDRHIVGCVFDPFFTTKSKGEGTGLGLATVHGIVSQAGGAVHVYTEPGLGTSMSVLLPAAEVPVHEPETRPSTRNLHGHETVLVIEDEEGIRDVVHRILARNGYGVILAGDGQLAIEVAEDTHRDIDLVLSDVVMPGMLGREVTANISRMRPDARIVYMSGYAQTLLDARGRLDPGCALLEKPFSEIQLLTIVREALEEAAA